LDIATVIGIVGATLLLVISIALGGSPLAFVNIPSLLIVVGGGLAASLASYPLKEMINGLKAVLKAFKPGLPDPVEHIDFLVEVVNKARKNGILALESDIDNTGGIIPSFRYDRNIDWSYSDAAKPERPISVRSRYGCCYDYNTLWSCSCKRFVCACTYVPAWR